MAKLWPWVSKCAYAPGLFEPCIDICAQAIYHDDTIPSPPPALSEQSFRELMEKVTSGAEFSFDGIVYKQFNGVTMALDPCLQHFCWFLRVKDS